MRFKSQSMAPEGRKTAGTYHEFLFLVIVFHSLSPALFSNVCARVKPPSLCISGFSLTGGQIIFGYLQI